MHPQDTPTRRGPDWIFIAVTGCVAAFMLYRILHNVAGALGLLP
jgi:hypothetical protein